MFAGTPDAPFHDSCTYTVTDSSEPATTVSRAIEVRVNSEDEPEPPVEVIAPPPTPIEVRVVRGTTEETVVFRGTGEGTVVFADEVIWSGPAGASAPGEPDMPRIVTGTGDGVLPGGSP